MRLASLSLIQISPSQALSDFHMFSESYDQQLLDFDFQSVFFQSVFSKVYFVKVYFCKVYLAYPSALRVYSNHKLHIFGANTFWKMLQQNVLRAWLNRFQLSFTSRRAGQQPQKWPTRHLVLVFTIIISVCSGDIPHNKCPYFENPSWLSPH